MFITFFFFKKNNFFAHFYSPKNQIKTIANVVLINLRMTCIQHNQSHCMWSDWKSIVRQSSASWKSASNCRIYSRKSNIDAARRRRRPQRRWQREKCAFSSCRPRRKALATIWWRRMAPSTRSTITTRTYRPTRPSLTLSTLPMRAKSSKSFSLSLATPSLCRRRPSAIDTCCSRNAHSLWRNSATTTVRFVSPTFNVNHVGIGTRWATPRAGNKSTRLNASLDHRYVNILCGIVGNQWKKKPPPFNCK